MKLNQYGDIDVRNGLPEGWIKTGAAPQTLRRLGVEYYSTFEGWQGQGRRVRPRKGRVIRSADAGRVAAAQEEIADKRARAAYRAREKAFAKKFIAAGGDARLVAQAMADFEAAVLTRKGWPSRLTVLKERYALRDVSAWDYYRNPTMALPSDPSPDLIGVVRIGLAA